MGKMNNSWEKFIADSQEVLVQFPGLEFVAPENAPPLLTGFIELNDVDGSIYDRYQISVVAPENPNMWFPSVFENDGRLPHNNDWHVFMGGRCCIKSVPEQIVLCRKGFSLLQFMSEQVLPYFHAQAFREQHGYYLHERSHG